MCATLLRRARFEPAREDGQPVPDLYTLRVDEEGTPGTCAPLFTERANGRALEALGAVACAQIKDGYRPPVAHDAQGKAVPSIQSATLRFDAAGPAADGL